ncbi:hypothetical protein ANCCAN_02741 [Ancylostoma caninum]|uniref:Uncharacterized protein n=1 Tax=Ancylostoma caninum TaxID=29170 RepID=A0A368H3I5_ANCCA|nr:hypothetical protein ANCCAN_02741 [Ancylostoma caninum]
MILNIIPNVSTIDAPPTYEQAKVHEGQKLKKGTTSPQLPPPYVDGRAYPGHLDFLQPVETQPGTEQGKPASKLGKKNDFSTDDVSILLCDDVDLTTII